MTEQLTYIDLPKQPRQDKPGSQRSMPVALAAGTKGDVYAAIGSPFKPEFVYLGSQELSDRTEVETLQTLPTQLFPQIREGTRVVRLHSPERESALDALGEVFPDWDAFAERYPKRQRIERELAESFIKKEELPRENIPPGETVREVVLAVWERHNANLGIDFEEK